MITLTLTLITSNLLSIDPTFLGGGLVVKIFYIIIAAMEAVIAIVKFVKLFAKDDSKIDKACDKILSRLETTKEKAVNTATRLEESSKTNALELQIVAEFGQKEDAKNEISAKR